MFQTPAREEVSLIDLEDDPFGDVSRAGCSSAQDIDPLWEKLLRRPDFRNASPEKQTERYEREEEKEERKERERLDREERKAKEDREERKAKEDREERKAKEDKDREERIEREKREFLLKKLELEQKPCKQVQGVETP